MAGQIINKAELALIFGVSLTAIDNWLRDGLPFVEKGGPGTGYKFDTAKVIEWRVDSAVEKAVKSEEKNGKDPFVRKTTAEAALAELKLERELGRMALLDDVERTWDKLTTAVRARMLAIPSRVAPLVFAADSVTISRSVIESAIHEALNELASSGVEATPVDDASTGEPSAQATLPLEAPAKIDRVRMGRSKAAAKRRGKR